MRKNVKTVLLCGLTAAILFHSGCTIFRPGTMSRALRLDEISTDMEKGVDYNRSPEYLSDQKKELEEQFEELHRREARRQDGSV